MTNFNLETRIKPILKWAGGKSAVLPQLIQHFPKSFDRFVEPFFGGGAVFFALNPTVPAIANDVNPELIELYTVVRDTPTLLIKKLDELTGLYSEPFYYQLRAANPSTSADRAARTIFLNKCGFNGLYRQNKKGEFNSPFGKRIKCPQLYDRNNLLRASDHLRNVNLCCSDFEEIIDRCGQGDLVYCDPPYEPISATASFTAYSQSGFTQNDQKRLHEAVKRAVRRGAAVYLSNSSARFVLDLYREWDVKEVEARRAINSNGSGRGVVVEVLVVGVDR